MSFRIGQRVRVVRVMVPAEARLIGSTGTIAGPADFAFGYTFQDVRWDIDTPSEYAGRIGHEPICCLEPIDDPKQFERFMERVLKPLPQPVLEAA